MWAESYRDHSRHQVELLTLPGRFWKWRMHGGGVTLARRFLESCFAPNLILATDMIDLTTFASLTRTKTWKVPLVLYMHENQLTYPLPKDPASGPMRRQKGERDLHYGFVNYVSTLAADRVVFNSHFHRNAFLRALPRFLKHFPEYCELETVDHVEAKSGVLPVGIEFVKLNRSEVLSTSSGEDPLLLWNQRWEYDKNPGEFIQAIQEMAERGLPFRLALCGEVFQRQPTEFQTAVTRLGDRLIHVGYAEKSRYHELLQEAEVAVSTAQHEFFGVSLLEAIAARTFPILPERLSYPELIPREFHQVCLYQSHEGLIERLIWALEHRPSAHEFAAKLSERVRRFDWAQVAAEYDAFLSQVRAAGNKAVADS
jgi:glycosyltransferase involved in cell wall biosynthesis